MLAPSSCLVSGLQAAQAFFCRFFVGAVVPRVLRAVGVFPEAWPPRWEAFPGLGRHSMALHILLVGHAVERGSQPFPALGRVVFEASLIPPCFGSVIFFGPDPPTALVFPGGFGQQLGCLPRFLPSRRAFRLRAGLNSPPRVGLCHDICQRGKTGRRPR